MYSFKSLPGSEQHCMHSGGVSGLFDWFGMPSWVKGYWLSLKNKIQALKDLGYEISLHQQKLGVAKYNLEQRGRKDLANELEFEIKKVQDDLDKWWKVKGYIDTYLPEWMKLDQNLAPASGVGFVPVVLAGMSLVALSYCVTTGLALLQDYSFKKTLTAAIIEGKMTSGQAAEVLSVPKPESALDKVVSTVGITAAVGLPTLLLVGGGLYLAVTTGMLKGVLGAVGVGGSKE